MIEYIEALNTILKKTTGPSKTELVSLEKAIGRVLSKDIFSDADQPPFDKSVMDGFAVKSQDVQKTPSTLDVVADIPAGIMPSISIKHGQAASIMTGAPIPDGADAVVKVEWTSGFGLNKVTVNRPVQPGSNINKKAHVLKAGQKALDSGRLLDVEEVSLLASVGADPVPVFAQPTAAVLSTGDELVPAGEKPGPGRIRNSNGPALIAFLHSLGIEALCLGQVGDDIGLLKKAVAKGLECDFLLLSGGVSAGAYDFVQDVLQELGVEIHLSQVAVKPGKPTVFGTLDDKVVFGLPGSPVAVMVITKVLVEPALRKKMGLKKTGPNTIKARLAAEIKKKPDRLWFVRGRLEPGEFGLVAPVKDSGSSDVAAASLGNCLIVAPAGKTLIEKGSLVDVIVWDRCIS